MLPIRERDTLYLLKGKYRYNGNSGSAWVYSFIVVVISSIYFRISFIFFSLWNSGSTCLSFSIIRIKCTYNFDCSSFSLILYFEEPVVSDKFLKRLALTVILSLYVVQQWRLRCGWHYVRTSWNCNLLLQRSLLPQQFIVYCDTKVTQSNSVRRRTSNINDLQYTIRAVALRSIVASSGYICGYGGNRSVGGNLYGAGVALMALEVTSTVLIDKGMHGRFLLRDSGVLW